MSNTYPIPSFDYASKYIGEHGKPLVDKITLTAPSPNTIYGNKPASEGYKDHETQFLAAAMSASHDKTLTGSAAFKHYKFATRIYLDSTSHFALLQMGPKNPAKNAFMRLEFNPNKMGEFGMSELNSNLTSFMDTGGEYFWDHGNVSKMDVAIDLHGVQVGQLRFLNKWGTTSRCIGTGGEFETIYIGKSTSEQTKIYNKAKLANLPKELTITRIERSLRPQKPLKDLLGQKNPFLHLSVANVIPAVPSFIDAKLWQLFLDSLERRGPVGALKLLPDELIKPVVKYMDENLDPIWKPHEFWQNWPLAVKPLFGAFEPVSFTKKAA